MRIVIDLQSCQSGSRYGGIGRYSLALAKEMIRQSRGHEFWIIVNNLLHEAIPTVRNEFKDLLPPDRVQIMHLPGPISESKIENKFRYQAAKLIREHFLQELQPDIIHVSSLIEGFYEDVTTSIGALEPTERTSATLYDLIPYVEQEIYLSDPVTRKHYLGKVDELRKAGLLLSISEYSRQEVIDQLGIPGDSVVNISSAADGFFRPVTVTEEAVASLRSRYGIRRKFLMYTSSFDMRKNQESLIKAFASLPSDVRSQYQLVIVGNGWDGVYRHLRQVAAQEGLEPDDLVFAGKAPDDDLLHLYNLASLFVFPSLREGFGLPILEAMSCGVPAIGSDATSIPEVIGMQEALFDPRSVSSIGRKIYECLTDDGLYKKLADHALVQAAKFSWERSARIALDAFEAHCEKLDRDSGAGSRRERPRHLHSYLGRTSPAYRRLVSAISRVEGASSIEETDLVNVARSIATNLAGVEGVCRARSGEKSPARIGWVTTWNTRCGIATYTIPVLKAMPASHFLFAPIEAGLVEPDGDNVFRTWKPGGNDDLSRLEAAVDEQEIDALIVQFNYGLYDFPALSDFLTRQVAAGRVVLVILHSTQDPPREVLDRRLSQLKDGFAGCHLFVHNALDVERLGQLGLKENVTLLTLGMHEDKPSSLELPALSGKFVIGSYGFALPNKGLVELVEAFSRVARNDPRLHLLMVNAEYPTPESRAIIRSVRERIAALGLESRATLLTDYLTNEDSIGYLRHSNLIVIPYQGSSESSSGSVRMSLAAERPVAVTPLKLFDDVRSAALILPGTSVAEIASGMKQFIAAIDTNDPAIKHVQNSARLWVQAHGFSSVGRNLFSIILMLLEQVPARAIR